MILRFFSYSVHVLGNFFICGILSLMKKMICVILCTYNGERYLRQQIDSILSQKLESSRALTCGLSLHVFDDCSTDGTRDILREYQAAFPDRVFLHLREKPSGGSCANFLDALRHVPDADLYMFSDQDDIWHEDKVPGMLDMFLNAGEARIDAESGASQEPILVFSDARVIASGAVIAPSFIHFQKLSPQRTKLEQLLVMNQVTGAACMFNHSLRDLIVSVPQPRHAIMHDHFIALAAACMGKIYYLDKPLYDYRQHESNVLGAQKGGLLLEVTKRLGLGEKSKDEMDKVSRGRYDALFDQAREFLELYGSRLSEEQKRTLLAFTSMKDMSRVGKIAAILRYGFTFNRFYRTMGEFLFI